MKADEINFPKVWAKLSEAEQKQWIASYYMPKAKIPEPVLKHLEQVANGSIKLQGGTRIQFPKTVVQVSKKNPDLVREYEGWVDKWLVTVFHDRNAPQIKMLCLSNPSSDKWIAQQLSSYVLDTLTGIILSLRWKYGFFSGNKRQTKRKISTFPLSLRDNMRGGEKP